MPLLVLRQVFVDGYRDPEDVEKPKVLRVIMFGLKRWCVAFSFWER